MCNIIEENGFKHDIWWYYFAYYRVLTTYYIWHVVIKFLSYEQNYGFKGKKAFPKDCFYVKESLALLTFGINLKVQ